MNTLLVAVDVFVTNAVVAALVSVAAFVGAVSAVAVAAVVNEILTIG